MHISYLGTYAGVYSRLRDRRVPCEIPLTRLLSTTQVAVRGQGQATVALQHTGATCRT
jgi:hypothetical protein